MFSLIIIIALCYFLYQFVSHLVTFEGAFGATEWIQLGMSILFVPLIVLMAIRYFRENKKNKEKQEEEMKKQQEELRNRRRAKYLVDEDGFDETYSELDKLPPADDDFGDEDVDIEEAAETFEEGASGKGSKYDE